MKTILIRRVEDETLEELKSIAREENLSLNTLMLDLLDIRLLIDPCSTAYEKNFQYTLIPKKNDGFIVWEFTKCVVQDNGNTEVLAKQLIK